MCFLREKVSIEGPPPFNLEASADTLGYGYSGMPCSVCASPYNRLCNAISVGDQ